MSQLVCIYCREPKGERLGCCGENHFAELEQEEADEPNKTSDAEDTKKYPIPDFLRKYHD